MHPNAQYMLLTEGDLLSFPYANDEWYFARVKSLPTEEEGRIMCTVEWQESGDEGDNAPEPMCLNNVKDGKAKIILGQMLGIDVRAGQLVAMPQDAPLGAELFMKELFVAEMLYKDHPKYYTNSLSNPLCNLTLPIDCKDPMNQN